MHILCICFNWISVVSDDVQELEVSTKENEMENSCSDIGEEHRVDELQGKPGLGPTTLSMRLH